MGISNTKILRASLPLLGGLTVEQIAEEKTTSGTGINLMVRMLARYRDAHEASKKLGYVGVGCITFAEERAEQFAQRVGPIITLNLNLKG